MIGVRNVLTGECRQLTELEREQFEATVKALSLYRASSPEWWGVDCTPFLEKRDPK